MNNTLNYPKISIIMPTFNSQVFICEALDSIRIQNYSNLEIVIVDGGSTDDTFKLIDKYSDLSPVIIKEKDFGLIHAVNKGVLKSSGEYLLWLNSDDLLFEESLLKVGKYLFEHKDIDLLYGNAAQIREDGSFIGWHAETYNKKRLLNERCFIPCQAAFFKKAALSYIGLFDTKWLWAGDWDMWKRFAINDDKLTIKFLDEKIGKWRLHRNTISYGGGSKTMLKQSLEIIRSTRKYSTVLLTSLEIKQIPFIIVGLLGLRKVLRSLRNSLKNEKQ